MTVLIIDGQGGKLGRQLVKSVSEQFPQVQILAVGTNSAATANMLKGGAQRGATGENAVLVACRSADVPSLPPLPTGSLCRRRGKGRLLALPWRPDGPFPWPELFCLARVGSMAGRCWVFYTLDEAGNPIFGEES